MCEEMAFMDDSLWDVIFPLTGRDKATLIGITTMDSYYNPVNQLFEMKDERGESIFRVISFDFVCDDCKESGKEMECDHMNSQLPPWLAGNRMKKMQRVYEIGDKSQQYLAEMKGVLIDNLIQPIFDKKALDRFESKPCIGVNGLNAARNIWVACDPYGQGRGSDYGLVSMVCQGERRIIVGMESYYNKHALAEYSVLFAHLHALREIPGLEHANIWLIPEDNMAGHAALHEIVASKVPNCYVMHESRGSYGFGGKTKRPGFHTDEKNKRIMAENFGKALANDRIYLYSNFVTVGGRSPTDMKASLYNQYRTYSRKIYPGRNPEDPVKEKITGKLRNGMKDDMAVMSTALHQMINNFFVDSAQYGNFWR